MYRVTTPTHTFNLPFSTADIDELILTYKQRGRIVLEKRKPDVTLVGNQIRAFLTQEETKEFDHKPAQVQIRIKKGNKVMASNILEINVLDVLNDEVM